MKKQKLYNDGIKHDSISSFFFSGSGYPHSLIDLSNNEVKVIKDTSFHLGSLSYSKKRTSYETLTIGSNANYKSATTIMNGELIRYHNTNLSKMKIE